MNRSCLLLACQLLLLVGFASARPPRTSCFERMQEAIQAGDTIVFFTAQQDSIVGLAPVTLTSHELIFPAVTEALFDTLVLLRSDIDSLRCLRDRRSASSAGLVLGASLGAAVGLVLATRFNDLSTEENFKLGGVMLGAGIGALAGVSVGLLIDVSREKRVRVTLRCF